MPNVHVDNTIQWNHDPDAAQYNLKIVALGAPETDPAFAEIPNHAAVAGAVVNVDGKSSVPASALLGPLSIGTSYDLYLRGQSAQGNYGPFNQVPFRLDVVSNIEEVIFIEIL